jgi:archaellum biogenesis ATPase FlaH
MFELISENGENRSQSAGETLQPLPNTRAATQESATGPDPETQRIGSDEARQFLQVLGKDPAAAWFRSIRPGKGANKRRKGADLHGFNADELAADSAAGDSLYVVIGNADTCTGKAISDADITSLPALFAEWDTGTAAEQQQALDASGLPEPSMLVHTGGKSLHAYWLLDEPISPEQWKLATRRLIAHTAADPQCSNPSRVMRLPGSTYYDKKTGKPTGTASIISAPGTRYALAALVEVLPDIDKKKTTTKSKPVPAPRADFAPRSLDDIQAAAQYIPERVVGGNTYETCRRALCGCAAALDEIGLPEQQALDLLAAKWPSTEDAQQALNSSTTRNPAAFWAIAKEHGFNTRRKFKVLPGGAASGQAPAEADPSRSEAQKLGFTELLEQALLAIRAKDLDTEMEIRAEIMGRFKRSDTQITASLFRLLTEQETGNPAGSTIAAEALDLDSIEGLDALLDGFIPANDLGLMYGAKGSGKTMAALAMAFAAIDGTGFLDHAKPAQQGPVLFIASDSGAPPLMAAMQDLGVADHAAIRGDHRSFYVWAHSARQGMESWCASINGCVQLLQFVKAKGIKLVLIDSAKTICAKAGISYLDNDSIAALLTFIKEAICPHTSVMILSHDGTEKGSHSGAKVWAEVPSIVHNIQQIPDAPHERVWRVVKNRMGTLRELRYQVGEDGRLEVCAGVETIQDGTAAVLQVLREASARGISSLSRAALVQEIQQRFRLAPKTIDNTLVRMVRAISPDVCRVASKRGHYKLSPRMAATVSPNNVSPNGKEKGKTPVIDSDLVTSRGVGSGNSRELKSEFPPTSHFPGGGKSSNASAGLGSDAVSSREVEMPIGGIELVEVFPQQTAHQSAPAWLPQLLAIRAANPTAHPSSIRHLLYGLHGIAVTVAQINAALKHLAESD